MKKLILSLLVVIIGMTTNAQKSTWLFDKSIKTISLIGEGIEGYDSKNKELLKDPMSQGNALLIKLDTTKLDNTQIVEFQHQAKEFLSSFFSTTSTRITKVELYNPIEYSLNYETVKSMPNNQYFIFAGQSADSIVFSFAFDRKTNIEVGEALEKITSVLTSAGVDITKASDLLSILDDSEIKLADSLRYNMTMKNPRGLFRVQVLKKKSTAFPSDKYWLHFPTDAVNRNNIEDTIKLTYGTPFSTTEYEKPRYKWYIPKANYVEFKLIIDKNKDEELKLGIQYKDGNTPITKWLIPKTNKGKKFWDEESLVYSYKGTKKVRKLVYCKVFAKQIDENTIEIIQKATRGMIIKRTTYLTYPEIKVKYLR